MAKPPKPGSKRKVADYVEQKLTKEGYKLRVIHPTVFAYFDNKYFWGLKIIEVSAPDNMVRITRTKEAGCAVVSEDADSDKLKLVYKKLSKDFEPQ